MVGAGVGGNVAHLEKSEPVAIGQTGRRDQGDRGDPIWIKRRRKGREMSRC